METLDGVAMGGKKLSLSQAEAEYKWTINRCIDMQETQQMSSDMHEGLQIYSG